MAQYFHLERVALTLDIWQDRIDCVQSKGPRQIRRSGVQQKRREEVAPSRRQLALKVPPRDAFPGQVPRAGQTVELPTVPPPASVTRIISRMNFG